MEEIELTETRAFCGESFEPRLGEEGAASGREQQTPQAKAPQSATQELAQEDPKDAGGHLNTHVNVCKLRAKKKKQFMSLAGQEHDKYIIKKCLKFSSYFFNLFFF